MSMRTGSYEIRKTGLARFDLRDPYYLALSLSGPQFVLLLLAIYLTINVVFALLYAAVPGCIENATPWSLSDAFFFSIETLATVGYGRMVPVTLYGHIVTSVEIFLGMSFVAVLTGVIFVRFSRPKSRIVYADRPVVTQYEGLPALMVRVGNARPTVLTRVQAQISALVRETTLEGVPFRRVIDLPLLRSYFAIFPMTLTLIHRIEATSPLAGLTSDTLPERDLILFLSLSARDATAAAEIADVKSYHANEIAFGMRYVDTISIGADGNVIADMRLVSALEPA